MTKCAATVAVLPDTVELPDKKRSIRLEIRNGASEENAEKAANRREPK